MGLIYLFTMTNKYKIISQIITPTCFDTIVSSSGSLLSYASMSDAVEIWWHTVTHGRGSEGETGEWSGWRGNWRMEWVASTLHTTSEHGVSSINTADGTRWRTGGGKWRGNCRMQWVASTLHTTSEHGVSSITTADAHNLAASSRLNWRPPADLNGLVRFAERRNLVFARVPSHFNWPLTLTGRCSDCPWNGVQCGPPFVHLNFIR